MEITVCMPEISPELDSFRLLSYGKSENGMISLGDTLFSYEADGALMHEYSPFRGRVELLIARVGETVAPGQAVMLVDAEEVDGEIPLFGGGEGAELTDTH